jgi:hypothetical protein
MKSLHPFAPRWTQQIVRNRAIQDHLLQFRMLSFTRSVPFMNLSCASNMLSPLAIVFAVIFEVYHASTDDSPGYSATGVLS